MRTIMQLHTHLHLEPMQRMSGTLTPISLKPASRSQESLLIINPLHILMPEEHIQSYGSEKTRDVN